MAGVSDALGAGPPEATPSLATALRVVLDTNVLDTNVLVSALVFPGGAPEAVWRRVLVGRLGVARSVPLLHQLDRVGWHDLIVPRAHRCPAQIG